MSESVRYIHTQAQAQAEIERCRHSAREQSRRRRQRYAATHDDTTRSRKQIHADRMARFREAQKEKNLELSAQERTELLEKVQLRLKELDAEFCDLQIREHQWPTPLPEVKPMYKKCVTEIHYLACNIVCASCGCIYHDVSKFETVPPSFEFLRHLRIPADVHIPFDFSCGIEILDQNRILIDKLGITLDNQIRLCRRCYDQLSKARLPLESLANFRWVGEQLNGLTWVEELLISRAHVCGSIIRLGQRNNPNAFLGIKGHCVFIPQDTTCLIDLIPISPSSLPEVVKVVWTGKSTPDKNQLQSRFNVRKNKVYDALKWLVDNHEDYKNNVIINENMVNDWDTEFVAVELLDSIGHVSDPSAEDACRDGFAMDDPDNDDNQDDLPLTSSGIVDTNNIAEIPDTTTLTRLAQLKDDITINVITGSKILNQYDCPT